MYEFRLQTLVADGVVVMGGVTVVVVGGTQLVNEPVALQNVGARASLSQDVPGPQFPANVGLGVDPPRQRA